MPKLALGTELTNSALDLPQLHTKPPAAILLATLDELRCVPPSWEMKLRSSIAPVGLPRKIQPDGLPAYLTAIISSPLAWISDDTEKERIWEAASARLTERSGRSAMGDLTRTFRIPLHVETGSSAERVAEIAGAGGGREEVGVVLELTLHEPALTADHLGLKTWAASYLLAKRLPLLLHKTHCLPALPSLTSDHLPLILELGAGTGLVGLAAAAVFQNRVLLTDLPAIVPNLERNARANRRTMQACDGALVQVAMLDWTEPEVLRYLVDRDHHQSQAHRPPAHSFPLILASDPIYSSEHPRLLVQAFAHHLSRVSGARVVLEIPLRVAYTAERQDFRMRMQQLGLEILLEGEEIGYDDWGGDSYGKEGEEVTCWWSIWGWGEV